LIKKTSILIPVTVTPVYRSYSRIVTFFEEELIYLGN
jgi:hypothetical protein